MIVLPSVFKSSSTGDEVVLNSIDWLENFPWRQESSIRSNNDAYEVNLNVKNFGPSELKVKTIDGFIVVEGKHEEKQDEHGFISRHFVRKYPIPEDCVPEKMESKLSTDGVLRITAPRKQMIKRDTMIPVSHESVKTKSKL